MPRCSQAKCRISDTGVCLDGRLPDCPHLLPGEPAGELPPDEVLSSETDVAPAPHRFHTGDKLAVFEASRLLNERPARVVLCAGARGSGKTTFLARLGEMFRDGSYSRYRFAGSLTLCAFERASWLATLTSGATRPDTTRTHRVENDTFLHLYIQPADNQARKLDLLISDLAGETFPTAVASREFCAGLHALARADHLVMFLDCARLADRAQRHPECNNAREFLQQVCAVKHNPSSLHVQVGFSRWDYITRDSQMATLEDFCRGIEADFIARFAQSFASLRFWRIAARPDNGSNPTNTDIQSLFAYWLETPLHASTPPDARNRQPAREFCAFGLI